MTTTMNRIREAFNVSWDESRDIGLNLNTLDNIRIVTSAEDLPDAENGVRTLDDQYNGYWFFDIVSDPATLDPNGVPLVGFHGSAGGYVHTGGTVAFQSTGTGFYADNFYGHAPGGQLFDLHADNTTRFYVTDSAFFDPGGLYGDINNLGVIDGFKVQTFKSVNFEDWQQGLTLTGSPKKTFFDTCPIRDVNATGATFVTCDTNYSSDILKFVGNYVYNVQSDTTVVDLSASGLPTNYFKYINVDHDETFNKSQVFNGFKKDDVGVIVRNSYPLGNSSVVGDLTLDAQTTVTGSGAGVVQVDDGTWTLNLSSKVSKPSSGVVQYDAKSDRDAKISARITIVGANTEFAVWIGQNGTEIPRSRVEDATAGASKPTTVDYAVQVQDATSDTPDQFSIYLENIGGTSDLDAVTANIKIEQV